MPDIADIPLALTFDDVLLVPQRSPVRHRGDVDTSVDLLPGLRLRIPLVSTNTQWCTGARMAVAMARAGGFGLIHRMQTVDAQVRQVEQVKKSEPGEPGSACTGRDGRLLVGAAVGVIGDYLDRAARLVGAGVDLLVVDVAHGHGEYTLKTVEVLKRRHPAVPIVAGNVATAQGCLDLITAGADLVKVGIGPGSICTTRQVAGTGIPQLTAIMDCAEAAAPHGIGVIADGGIRYAGDIAKAIAAGARVAMLGSLIAGSDESEARLVHRDGVTYKVSKGFVTLGMKLTLRAAAGEKVTLRDLEGYVPEGVEATFPYTGPLARTITQLVGGLRSAMSYSGAPDLAVFHKRARFVRVTSAGMAENGAHIKDRHPQLELDYMKELDQEGVTE